MRCHLRAWFAVVSLLLAGCGTTAPSDDAGGPVAGVTTLQFRDAPRDRALLTELWYPAAAGASTHQERYVFVFTGRAARDAPVEPGAPRPLVMFSHGSGSFRQDLAWLAEPLARAGHIVASVGHPFNQAGGDVPQQRLMVWQRPQDVSFVLGALLAHPEWGPRIDGNRVGAVGYSLGGYTVLQLAGARYDVQRARKHCVDHPRDMVCDAARGVDRSRIDYRPSGASYRDPRVDAVVALAPAGAPATTPESAKEITIPLLIIATPDDQILQPDLYAHAWSRLLGQPVTMLPAGDHFTFITPCNVWGRLLPVPSCDDPPGVDRSTVQRKVVGMVERFFSETLR